MWSMKTKHEQMPCQMCVRLSFNFVCMNKIGHLVALPHSLQIIVVYSCSTFEMALTCTTSGRTIPFNPIALPKVRRIIIFQQVWHFYTMERLWCVGRIWVVSPCGILQPVSRCKHCSIKVDSNLWRCLSNSSVLRRRYTSNLRECWHFLAQGICNRF